MQLTEIIAHLKRKGVELEVEGDCNIEINQVSGLDIATADNISFLTDKKYLTYLNSSAAGVVILSSKLTAESKATQIRVANPHYVYALVTQFLNPFMEASGIVHDSALVSETASVHASVNIGENAVVHANVSIAENSIIASGCVIEQGASIGKNCRIGSNVTICHGSVIGDDVFIESGAVIGGDGFGWANNAGNWVKIPQIGKVVIGNNVSIGNNTTIDRGAIEDTIIEDNCIIDNLVHIAHNVKIGSGTAVTAQVGFAGSTKVGKNCTFAGQSGIAGHIEIADNSHFLAKSGITNNIKEAGTYAGFPAVNASVWQKNSVRIRQLDKLTKQVKDLQKQIKKLTD